MDILNEIMISCGQQMFFNNSIGCNNKKRSLFSILVICDQAFNNYCRKIIGQEKVSNDLYFILYIYIMFLTFPHSNGGGVGPWAVGKCRWATTPSENILQIIERDR